MIGIAHQRICGYRRRCIIEGALFCMVVLLITFCCRAGSLAAGEINMITPIASNRFVDAIGIQPALPNGDQSDADFARNVACMESLGIHHAIYSIPPWIPNALSHINSRRILYMASHGVKTVVLTKLKVDGNGEYHCDEPKHSVYPPKCTTPPPDVVKIVKLLGPGRVVEGVVGPNEYLVGSHNDDPQAPVKLRAYMTALKAALAADESTRNLPIIGPTLDPSPYVINPKTGKPKGNKWTEIWDTSVQPNFEPYVTYGNIHIYDLPFDESFKGQADRNAWEKRLFDYELAGYPKFGKGKFAMTETGFATTTNAAAFKRAVTSTEQARYLPRQLLRYFKQGFHSIYIYQLQDRGRDLADKEQCFGIITADGACKPAFFAVKRLLNLLSDPNTGTFRPTPLPVRVESSSNTVDYQVFQKHSGTNFIALWNMIDSGDNVPTKSEIVRIQIDKRFSKAELYDVVKSEQPTMVPVQDGHIDLHLDKDVLLLKLGA